MERLRDVNGVGVRVPRRMLRTWTRGHWVQRPHCESWREDWARAGVMSGITMQGLTGAEALTFMFRHIYGAPLRSVVP